MSTFDENGYTIDRYDEIREKISNACQSSFGEAAASDNEDSVMGKFVTIVAEASADLNENLEYAIASFDSDNASGTALKKLVKLNGITANEALYSTASIDVTSNEYGVTIEVGDKVNDPNNPDVTWSVDTEVTLAASSSGSTTVTCDTVGAIEAGAGTLTEIATPRLGWSTTTNPAAATVGQNEETSTELRRRRDLGSQSYGLSTLYGVWKAVADIDNVDDVYVRQNLNSNTTDEYGVPPRNIWVIVSGGSNSTIAEVLFKTAPLQTYGSSSATYDYLNSTYTLYFQRPTDTDINIEITYSATTNINPLDWPSDGEQQVKDALVDWGEDNQTMGVDAIPNNIIAGVGDVIEGYYASEVLINGADATVYANIDERLVISDGNITVNVA